MKIRVLSSGEIEDENAAMQLRHVLLAGERPLWTGHPAVEVATAELLSSTRGQRLGAAVFTTVAGLIVWIIEVAVLQGSLHLGNAATQWISVPATLVLAYGSLTWWLIANARSIRRGLASMSYAVTNHRLLIFRGAHAYTWPLSSLAPPIVIPRAQGTGHVVFGSTAIPGPPMLRVRSRDSYPTPGSAPAAIDAVSLRMPRSMIEVGTTWIASRDRPVLVNLPDAVQAREATWAAMGR